MKFPVLGAALLILLTPFASRPALAQLNGEPYIHDPSTVAYDNGKYYTFGTGSGGLISDDGGWTWHSGAVRDGGRSSLRTTIIQDWRSFFAAYAVGGGGMSGGHASSNVKNHVDEDVFLDPEVARLRLSR